MRAIRINRFVQEEDQFEWLVEGLLPNVGWTLCVGTQGVGKSTFVMQLAAALQEGTSFLGRPCKQRDIMFIQADSHPIEWKTMLKRIAPNCDGYTVVEVPAKCLGNAEYVSRIAHYVEQLQPGFIVWDSLYNLTAWSTNTETVLMPINLMKGICGDIPFLVIHHPPHGESRAAGHHSLAANCSQVWVLLKTRLNIEKGRILGDKEVIKNKAIRLTRDEHGLWIPRQSDDESTTIDDPFLNALA